jgi:hypothetical protein
MQRPQGSLTIRIFTPNRPQASGSLTMRASKPHLTFACGAPSRNPLPRRVFGARQGAFAVSAGSIALQNALRRPGFLEIAKGARVTRLSKTLTGFVSPRREPIWHSPHLAHARPVKNQRVMQLSIEFTFPEAEFPRRVARIDRVSRHHLCAGGGQTWQEFLTMIDAIACSPVEHR